MTLHMITTMEKLAEVERLIEEARRTAGAHSQEAEILRAIAADLRARLDGVPGVALTELERRLGAVKRSRLRATRDLGPMLGVAEEVIARWPILKQALERFGAEVQEAG